MAVFKCKMCGGTLEIQNNETVATCDYCGAQQTLPKTASEVLANLFNRANNLRLKCEFDKAEQIYEKILEQEPDECEAHWGIVLCKYGIEYVEDPKTLDRIPTCHRTLYEAVTANSDYLAAIASADLLQKSIYEAEAKRIDEIQKNILAIVAEEKPFDVFICYKETDENGKRTVDSAIANDIYYQLTQEGLKVFYAAITLEDKLGTAYEPYIFAALNSAKAMLVLGTKPEYFNAVWVKNEWSRFMKLMKTDRKKLLIPCYRDMDAYELPEEFAHLQAQDMGKIGFINDVVRGIKKVAVQNELKPTVKETVKETVVVNQNAGASVSPLLERMFMFLEDGEWQSADEYAEKVLDQDPKNGEAYLGKLMGSLHLEKRTALASCPVSFEQNAYYEKALKFGNEGLKKELEEYLRGNRETVKRVAEEKAEEERLETIEKAKWRKKITKIAIVAVCVCSALLVFIVLLNTVIIPMKNESVEIGYKNESVEIGDYITFGRYEQDNNTSNGKEDIEWLVLDKKDGKALVISKYALDCQPYNTSYTDVTWETCTLRKWLNNTFLNAAFTDAEKSLIPTVTVSADKNPKYSTNPGNATQDKVFLLSITEVNEYFNSDSARQCKATAYAEAQGAYVNSSNGNCWWWLRSPGYNQNYAALVLYDGYVYEFGYTVFQFGAVRLALWIDLNS